MTHLTTPRSTPAITIGVLPRPKFKIGDIVCISAYKNIFQKGYEANFTQEWYHGDLTMYKIEDMEGEDIVR